MNSAVYFPVSPTFGILLPESAHLPGISSVPSIAFSPETDRLPRLPPNVPEAVPEPLAVSAAGVIVNVQSGDVASLAAR